MIEINHNLKFGKIKLLYGYFVNGEIHTVCAKMKWYDTAKVITKTTKNQFSFIPACKTNNTTMINVSNIAHLIYVNKNLHYRTYKYANYPLIIDTCYYVKKDYNL